MPQPSPTVLATGTRMHGCFMGRSDTLLLTPADQGTNTGSTAPLQARAVDPLGRATLTTFWIDRVGTFNTAYLVASSQVPSRGGKTAAWSTPVIANYRWYWRARTSAQVGGTQAGVTGTMTAARYFQQEGGAGIPRSLYLYKNNGRATVIPAVGPYARALYLYKDNAMYPGVISVASRSLYAYVDHAMYPGVLAAGLRRAVYLYESTRDGEVFPWLNHINPTEQYEGGQIDLYGDGFGEYLEVAAGATITVDSTNGSYIPANAVDRSTGSWVSNNNRANAWIRFTFGGTKRIVAIALEGAGNGWGVPRFRFSDASEVSGVYAVPDGVNMASEYPCGSTRRVYWLAAPKDTTYVEIRGPVGDGTSFIGLYEVWIYERVVPAENAEVSRAWLNLDLLTVKDLGIVTWQNRSPNWWPANSGVAPTPAATVTIPSGATSGLVTVQEET